jgi:iron(III) transport system substrate-binding protein
MTRKLAILLALLSALTGCAKAEPPDPLAGWLESASLNAEETPEQLYSAALNEDTLVVYSTSTRMMDVAKSFEKQYPGLTARVEHIREGELIDKLLLNYESGAFACDLALTADGQGIMLNEFFEKNIVNKYVPYDIAEKILPGNNGEMLYMAGEAAMFAYNDSLYPEPPVNNWWELTEEKWRGMVYMPNPSRSTTTLALFNMIIYHSDMMAKAYEDLYGEPLILPEGENAGREFVRRLMMNGANIVNSSDETAAEIGAPGSFSPRVGIMVSSKTRLREIGYEMENHYQMQPFCGVYTPISLMVAGGSKNINAAKLYVRWLLGEADGQGEGYAPYLKSGAWTVRSDVADETGVRSGELDLIQLDKQYLYHNREEFLEFWTELIEARG